jgi:leader peptidase (prepilin peptidase)/N-methyltransferase|tara:strand:- start:393 stop:1034 length:642 start_codon:yes stop_codon:yes gene_type:complete
MILLSIPFAFLFGYLIKRVINWLEIDGFKIKESNFILEILLVLPFSWAYANLQPTEFISFSLMSAVLFGIAYVDYKTFQIPLIFIIVGVTITVFNVYIKNIYLTAALWGIFVGAVIPLLILAGMWVITKRQGMGFGDIQLGFVLGAWLGPMRMALTLFFASFLSLLTWIAVSIFKGFDKDRAIPMAPFLTIAAMSIYIGSFYYPDFFYLLITD